ncbi:hypothetical protein ATANTOWER_022325 [Ataeniobius toweri]|uniref:Uncharacterized protein n=1 Tax=Ataeniobius toweri TaxID=208326 RepID=A0ABU7BH21_9TELE|nr:hypothetical protein [Ataeniobius toweri]
MNDMKSCKAFVRPVGALKLMQSQIIINDEVNCSKNVIHLCLDSISQKTMLLSCKQPPVVLMKACCAELQGLANSIIPSSRSYSLKGDESIICIYSLCSASSCRAHCTEIQ